MTEERLPYLTRRQELVRDWLIPGAAVALALIVGICAVCAA